MNYLIGDHLTLNKHQQLKPIRMLKHQIGKYAKTNNFMDMSTFCLQIQTRDFMEMSTCLFQKDLPYENLLVNLHSPWQTSWGARPEAGPSLSSRAATSGPRTPGGGGRAWMAWIHGEVLVDGELMVSWCLISTNLLMINSLMVINSSFISGFDD